jgi:cytosine/adenosine deaminase-related metal-dependent hydrolase
MKRPHDPAKTLIRAAWVAPMDRPPIPQGGIVFARGDIVAVGDAITLLGQHPDSQIIDRPADIILPGLINAHTHLELSEFACGSAPASFVEWVTRLVPRGQVSLESVHASVARSIPLGIAQCLRSGVTAVGDISRHCTVARPLLQNGPLRAVSYGEIQAMAQRRGLLEERLAIASDPTFQSDHLDIALSPHAPYSVEIDGYRRCVALARAQHLPLATHLAETPDEATFLSIHAGPFRELWEIISAWDEQVPTCTGGPIRMARDIGLLDYEKTLLAHVNYCDDDEMKLLANGKASVVYCPRTHAYFGHPPHRWKEMLAMGINVAIGTDSCASSPDLNLVDELRLLHQLEPQIEPLELWKLVTIRAAQAIGKPGRLGVLCAGAAADLVLFPAGSADPLKALLENSISPNQTWIGGDLV